MFYDYTDGFNATTSEWLFSKFYKKGSKSNQ